MNENIKNHYCHTDRMALTKEMAKFHRQFGHDIEDANNMWKEKADPLIESYYEDYHTIGRKFYPAS